MAVLRTRIDWASEPFGTLVPIEDVESINIRRGDGLSNNSCTVTLTNSRGVIKPYQQNGQISFSPEQPFNIYATYDTDGSGLSDTPIFSGRVMEFDGESSDDESNLKIKASDASYIALNRVWIGEETGTVPEIIEKVISFINENTPDPGLHVSYNSSKVQQVDSNGDPFPTITYSSPGKPAYEVLSDLCEPLYTGEEVNINYRFHVDEDQEINWFYPDVGATHVLVEGSTEPNSATYRHPITQERINFTDNHSHKIIETKLKNAVYDVVNFIIYKAGEDIEGDQIMGFAFDPTSGVPVTKDSFRSYEKITKALKREEEKAGNLSKTYGDRYEFNGGSGTTSWGEPFSGAENYNAVFTEYIEKLAQVLAEREFRMYGSPRWQGTIQLQGTDLFRPNDALTITSDRLGLENLFMRVTEVSHRIGRTGWFTTITVKQEIRRSI